MSLGTSRIVKGRKDHRCDLCGWDIPKGQEHWTWTLPPSVGDFDMWFTGRTHLICDRVYRASEYFDPHEPMPDEWTFRTEILEQVETATNDWVVWR